MSQPKLSSSGAVVIDANILISICSKEPTHATAESALADYTARNWAFYAPSVILTEALFVLRKKHQNGVIDAATYKKSVEDFNDYMSVILPPPSGDVALLLRTEEISSGYSCLHTTDGFYIALAEELAQHGDPEFVTFDKRVVNVAAKNAPTVKINLLPT
jgi:predicted nucleic acid-binding protein